MKQLEMFVCETFEPEYQRVLDREHLSNVSVVSFPCICEDKSGKPEIEKMINDHASSGKDVLVFCNRKCDPSRVAGSIRSRVCSGDLCISNIADEERIAEALINGGYIVGPGKLMNWQKYLSNTGLTREQSARFFRNPARNLYFSIRVSLRTPRSSWMPSPPIWA